MLLYHFRKDLSTDFSAKIPHPVGCGGAETDKTFLIFDVGRSGGEFGRFVLQGV